MKSASPFPAPTAEGVAPRAGGLAAGGGRVRVGLVRYEVKFTEDELPLATWMESWVARQPALYEAYPERSVHSLYFDTPDLQAAAENFRGAPGREKFRLRWYSSPPDDAPHGPAVFERKVRAGVFGSKHSFPSLLDGRGLLRRASDGILRAVLEEPGFLETFRRVTS